MQTYGTYNVAGEKIHTHKKITKHTMPLIRHNKPCDYPKTVLEGQKGGPEYKEKASRARQSKACVSWKETRYSREAEEMAKDKACGLDSELSWMSIRGFL